MLSSVLVRAYLRTRTVVHSYCPRKKVTPDEGPHCQESLSHQESSRHHLLCSSLPAPLWTTPHHQFSHSLSLLLVHITHPSPQILSETLTSAIWAQWPILSITNAIALNEDPSLSSTYFPWQTSDCSSLAGLWLEPQGHSWPWEEILHWVEYNHSICSLSNEGYEWGIVFQKWLRWTSKD